MEIDTVDDGRWAMGDGRWAMDQPDRSLAIPAPHYNMKDGGRTIRRRLSPVAHPPSPMSLTDLERLYDYHYWANRKLLDAVSQLTTEQFTQTVAGSYGSIRNTLVHILSAEWGWLDRCGGPPRGERLRAEDYPTLASVVETWDRVERDMRAFLAGLREEDLSRDVEFSFGAAPKHSIPVSGLLQHAVVHAVHHRGQVSMLVRMLGFTPGNYDLLMFDSQPRDTPAALKPREEPAALR